MRTAALLWHVSLLAPPEKKALALGMVGLVRVMPIVVFSFVSGIVADASDRRKLMMLTNVSMMAISGALALVTFTGRDSLTVVYASRGRQRRHGLLRQPRAPVALSLARSARAPAERHQPEQHHDAGLIGAGPARGRAHHRLSAGLPGSTPSTRLRSWRCELMLVLDERRSRAAGGGERRAQSSRRSRRVPLGLSPAAHSIDDAPRLLRRRSSPRRKRSCRSSPRTSWAWVPADTAFSRERRRWARWR